MGQLDNRTTTKATENSKMWEQQIESVSAEPNRTFKTIELEHNILFLAPTFLASTNNSYLN
jgi:hypothetical protein